MKKVTPLKWPGLFLLFGIPTVLNLIACQLAIPWLDSQKTMPIEVAYFISVGLLVLVPMFFGAIYLSAREIGSFRIKDLFYRMRIKRLSRADTAWTVGSFMLLSLASFLTAKIILPQLGIDATPFFFRNMPLNDAYFWIIYVWPLFFLQYFR